MGKSIDLGSDLDFDVLKIEDVQAAVSHLKGIVKQTDLQLNQNISEHYKAQVFLKREDLQVVRSYKLRGAFNKISSLTEDQRKRGVVCASAGNHAQGFAWSCHKLEIHGIVFMPITTPGQKLQQVMMFGKQHVEVKLVGDTYDDSYAAAVEYCGSSNKTFVHPFNDPLIMAGQGTVGLEILAQCEFPVDYLFLPIGGGGLASGVGTVFKTLSPRTKIIGVEPQGAPAMKKSMEAGEVITLKEIDKFVDGAAVKKVEEYSLKICSGVLDDIITVPEGKICSTILKLYNKDAIVIEPAGALSIAALETYKSEIAGKNVVCVVSGGNNDITRMEEIKERALMYEGLLHYFIVRFPQRAGALREFLTEVLGAQDDIIHFQYTRKNARERGPAVVGLELKDPADFDGLLNRMKSKGFFSEYLNERPDLFGYLV